MDSLSKKLIDLGYEFVGILLPGFLGLLILLGLLMGYTSLSTSPGTVLVDQALRDEGLNKAVAGLLVLVVTYLYGHTLKWCSRGFRFKCLPPAISEEKGWLLTSRFLVFGGPRIKHSYKQVLDPLFLAIMPRLRPDLSAEEISSAKSEDLWSSNFRIAKSLLAQEVGHSLVSTYQNKYTLHRSIATAFAIGFWFQIVLMIILRVNGQDIALATWAWMIPILVVQVALVNFFARSFGYYWVLFGDALISETYAMLWRQKKFNG